MPACARAPYHTIRHTIPYHTKRHTPYVIPYHTIRHIIVCPPDNRGEFRSSLLLAMIHIWMRLLLMLMKLKPMMTIPSRCRSKVAKFGISSFGYFVFCLLNCTEASQVPPSPLWLGRGLVLGGTTGRLHLKPVIGNAPPPHPTAASYCHVHVFKPTTTSSSTTDCKNFCIATT